MALLGMPIDHCIVQVDLVDFELQRLSRTNERPAIEVQKTAS